MTIKYDNFLQYERWQALRTWPYLPGRDS